MGDRRRDGHTEKCFEQQADATINQANPASGTKYTVLDTTKRCRIISIAVKCTWTVQPTPLEVHITIDGQPFRFSFNNPLTDTFYYALINAQLAPTALLLTEHPTDYTIYRAFLFEGRSVKVEAEITGGTVSNLAARVKYAVIP